MSTWNIRKQGDLQYIARHAFSKLSTITSHTEIKIYLLEEYKPSKNLLILAINSPNRTFCLSGKNTSELCRSEKLILTTEKQTAIKVQFAIKTDQ